MILAKQSLTYDESPITIDMSEEFMNELNYSGFWNFGLTQIAENDGKVILFSFLVFYNIFKCNIGLPCHEIFCIIETFL